MSFFIPGGRKWAQPTTAAFAEDAAAGAAPAPTANLRMGHWN
jgi:hypothetical protein